MAYFIPKSDDAFDEEAEDNMVVHKEWHRTENDIRKSGYRLGLSAGQEETLQQGFDAGYREAALTAFAVGRLQGQISAKLSLLDSARDPSDSSSSQQESKLTQATNLMKLLEDCAQLHLSIPQKLQLQSQKILSELPSGLHQAQLYTGNQMQPSESENKHGKEGGCGGSGDGLGEITELLGVIGIQDLSPIRNHELREDLLNLLRRYRSLLTQ